MSKFKICVYAICKNEEKFVDSWVDSMSEADKIIVLDTGSSDKTVEKLKKRGVEVHSKIISPWRFDVARNECLKLIPKDMDLCCSIDLDERFNKGWRKVLEDNISQNTSRVAYRYTWNFLEDGSEGVVFFADKIHRNRLFIWEHPVHETLKQIDFSLTEYVTIPSLQLNHYADNKKSRSSYLPLLELSVKEDPKSDRNMHYLGREYYFYNQFEKAIETLKKHLEMPNSIWDEERSSSCRIIAACYQKLNRFKLAKKYYQKSITESPSSRESYYEIGKFLYRRKNYLEAVSYLLSGLNIQKRELNYMSQPECWNGFYYDLIALCFYSLKDYKKAYKYGEIATLLSPNDSRIKDNFNYYCYKLNKNK